MKFVKSSDIEGTIIVPPSKSISQRLLLNSLFDSDEIRISNLSHSDDTKIIIQALMNWGKKISTIDDVTIVSGKIAHSGKIINLGESGFCARVLPLIALHFDGITTFTGANSLFKRPLSGLSSIADHLDAEIKIDYANCLICVKGTEHFVEIYVDGNISSQYLTGLLYLYSLKRSSNVIHVNNLQSKGYINLTLTNLESIGVKFENVDFAKFKYVERVKSNKLIFEVESDWSAASFLLVLGAISGEIEIFGLNINSIQPDKEILNLLNRICADIRINADSIKICKSMMQVFDYDAAHTPDLVPALIPLALSINGDSTISGVKRLQLKESDRLVNLVREYKKLGAEIYYDNDTISITGSTLIGGKVQSFNDHRLVMSYAIAGSKSKFGVYIDNHECVNKSYPKFWDDMNNVKLNFS